MTENIERRLLIFTIIIILAVSPVLLVAKDYLWASGFMVGALWMLVNVLMMIKIFKIALLKSSPNKLKFILLIKFPVLYIAGFYILISKFFPLASILIGIPAVFLSIGVIKICPKLLA